MFEEILWHSCLVAAITLFLIDSPPAEWLRWITTGERPSWALPSTGPPTRHPWLAQKLQCVPCMSFYVSIASALAWSLYNHEQAWFGWFQFGGVWCGSMMIAGTIRLVMFHGASD